LGCLVAASTAPDLIDLGEFLGKNFEATWRLSLVGENRDIITSVLSVMCVLLGPRLDRGRQRESLKFDIY